MLIKISGNLFELSPSKSVVRTYIFLYLIYKLDRAEGESCICELYNVLLCHEEIN